MSFQPNDGLTWHQRKANLKRWYRIYIGSHDFAFVTMLLLAINIGVYLLETWSQLFLGDPFNISARVLVEFGAKYTPYIHAGDYWRLWTPMFVHLNPIHLLLNMATLYFVGPLLEREIGAVRTTCVYLLSGLAGNFLSFLLFPESISAGASTSLFGMTIYAALLLPNYRRHLSLVLAANLIYNLVDPIVDIYGHLGGLIGGIILAALFFDIDEINFVRIPTWVRSVIAVSLTGMLLAYTFLKDYLP